MLEFKSVAVVIPAFNEASQIEKVLTTMPGFVDEIVVVDDASSDNTAGIVLDIGQTDSRIKLIRHAKNGGVGLAIASGYKYCLKKRFDCTAVMAGDGQMDPAELESICEPVVTGAVDYSKGNRMNHPAATHAIPKRRYLGIKVLSAATRMISGYENIQDSQTGFTAISLHGLASINLDKIYRKYGMPNDLLIKLALADCTMTETTITPLYNVGEVSKMRLLPTIPRITLLLGRLWVQASWVRLRRVIPVRPIPIKAVSIRRRG